MQNVSRQHLNGRIRVTILAILISLVGQTGSAQTVSDSADSGMTPAEQTMFTKGQTLYNHGLYGEAIATLNELLTKYPSSTIKDLGLLWLGRCYLAQGDIANAEKIELRLKDIPDTPLSSLYEDELRVARQAFVKMATPKSEVTVSKKETTTFTNVSAQPAPVPSAKNEPVKDSVLAKADTASVPKVAPKTPVVSAAMTAKTPTVPTSKGILVTPTLTSRDLRGREKEGGPDVAMNETAPAVILKTPAPDPAKKEIAPTIAQKTTAAIAPAAIPVSISRPVEKPITPSVQAAGAPLLRAQIKGIEGNNPNDRGVYQLIIVNEGAGRATDLTIRVELDLANDFLNSDLPVRQEMVGQRRILTFKLAGIEAGETRDIVVTLRAPIVSGKGVLQHMVFYKDNQGKFLHTP